MSPLMMLLSFMLPLLTAVIQNVNGADLHSLFPSNPSGDVLNVTQCYCQSPNPLAPNATFGYYQQFDYFNWHLKNTFPISVNCTSPAPDKSNGRKSDKCMKQISKRSKECRDYNGDYSRHKFCFKFKEDVNNHSSPSRSEYRFDGQKRDVPAHPSDILSTDDVTKDCNSYCNALGGLITIKTSSTLIPGIGPVTNSIVGYSDLDDMCQTCA